MHLQLIDVNKTFILGIFYAFIYYAQWEINTHTHSHSHTHTQTHTQTHKHTHRQTHTQTHKLTYSTSWRHNLYACNAYTHFRPFLHFPKFAQNCWQPGKMDNGVHISSYFTVYGFLCIFLFIYLDGNFWIRRFF